MKHPVLAPPGPSQGRRVFEANFRVYGVSKIWRQLGGLIAEDLICRRSHIHYHFPN
jgi:hypothetical protein